MRQIKIFIVAGELSGDLLGAGLMQALRQRYPDLLFRGLGGPAMQAQGLESLAELDALNVMGFFEIIRHLPRLFRLRRQLRQAAINWKADLMIGIDAPDFNLGLEAKLKRAGIRVVHYVSPSVWAWRQNRVKKIKKNVDLMLTLLPFEAEFYQRHRVPVKWVGHPLADQLPLQESQIAARQAYHLPMDQPILAVLPGSRTAEIQRMLPIFIQTVRLLKAKIPDLTVVIAAATHRFEQIKAMVDQSAELDIRVFDAPAATLMTASNAVLLTSGTASLEAMCCHRPMAVCYCTSPWTYALAKRLIHVQWIALPNLLAQQTIVPEFVQAQVEPEALSSLMWTLLTRSQSETIEKLRTLHQELALHANERAAIAVSRLLPLPLVPAKTHVHSIS